MRGPLMTIFKLYLPNDSPPFFSLPEKIKGKPQSILTNNSWSGLFGSLQYGVKAQSERNARADLPTFLCYHPSSTWEKRHDVPAKVNKHSPAIPFSLSQPSPRIRPSQERAGSQGANPFMDGPFFLASSYPRPV